MGVEQAAHKAYSSIVNREYPQPLKVSIFVIGH